MLLFSSKASTDSLQAYSQKHKEAWGEIDESFSPTKLSDNPILAIPSGGLAGKDKSKLFKAKIADYANKGGTVICLAHQHGTEFKALPLGNQISAYGWREDQSCQSSAVYIDTYHQMFSGLGSTSPCNVSVDGYFSSIPDNSTILLRRTKNNMPALISYPYSKGRVIAGTMFTDWAYGMNSASA